MVKGRSDCEVGLILIILNTKTNPKISKGPIFNVFSVMVADLHNIFYVGRVWRKLHFGKDLDPMMDANNS